MKLVEYQPAANPEYLDQVVDALLAEAPELKGVEVERAVVRAMLEKSPQVKCLVHVQDGTLLAVAIMLVGPVWYAPKRRCARDLLVWVAPSHRGSSLGPRLVDWIEEWAREKDLQDLFLGQSTGIAVERTAEFYQRKGFTLSGFSSHKRLDHVLRT